LNGDDGNYKYSDVRQVNLKLTDASIRILPNPIASQASMEVRTQQAESARLKLVDVNGKTVEERSFTLEAGLNRVDVSRWNRFPSGVYMLYVATPSLNLNAKVVIQ